MWGVVIEVFVFEMMFVFELVLVVCILVLGVVKLGLVIM